MKDCFDTQLTSISPLREAAAYEALWNEKQVSFKKIAELFQKYPNSTPSSFISEDVICDFTEQLKEKISLIKEIKTRVIVNFTFDYPQKLRDAGEPVELLYYTGNINYIKTKGIALVGTRHPTTEGLKRTDQLVRELVKDNYTIYSGLAEGIDTMAHKSAIKYKGKTVAVIGTPLNEFYPKQNKELQLFIAKNHLLISQVPFIRYSNQDYRMNRLFFPERNKTMSALSEATVIVEAGETSGSLIQAKAALDQNRKLFILQSCFENKLITWPSKFEEKGAIRVRSYEDIKNALK